MTRGEYDDIRWGANIAPDLKGIPFLQTDGQIDPAKVKEWFATKDTNWPNYYPVMERRLLENRSLWQVHHAGILAREAERMDPQQRLFLEVAIEAFDDAGLPRERLRGSRTGVYVTSYHNDYTQLQYADIEAVDARTLTGTLHSVLVNRLSYLLDLRGPSLSLDTACSSCRWWRSTWPARACAWARATSRWPVACR